MNSQRWVLSAVIALGVVASKDAAAQNYYAGVEVGNEHVSFNPNYSFVSGATNRSFDNEASGTGVGVLAGYRWKVAPDFSISLQGRLSTSNADWKLDLAEPASLKYAIPVTAAVSLLPTFKVSEKISLFAEGGIAMGEIEERKSAVSTSRYDVKEWQPGVVAGAGMSIAVDDQWSVHIEYRRTWYNELSYDSHLANGTHVETIRDKPIQSMLRIGLIREF